jgi:CubicO group peptidase (beta-lactamase class C family)
MSKVARISVLLVLLTVGLTSAGSDSKKPANPLEPPTTFDLKAIDAYVASQSPEKGFVGLSLAILRDGNIIFAKGYGNRSMEPGSTLN